MANKLALELVADVNPLIKGLSDAQRAVDKFSDAAASAGGRIGGGLNQALEAFKGLATGGVVAAGVLAGALVAAGAGATVLAVKASEQAEELVKLSAELGVGTDKLQEYDVLLNRTGLSTQDLGSMFKTLSTNLEQAKTGTGTAADRFRQLGIDITKVTSTDDLIRKVANSISHFADGTGKAAIVADLLGKQGLQFINTFHDGAASIDEAAAASERLGATLSAGQLETLNRLNDSLADLSIAWKRFAQQLAAFVAPAVQFVTDLLAQLLGIASDTLKQFDSSKAGPAAQTQKPEPPKLVNAAQVAAQARAITDAQQKLNDSLFANSAALGQAQMDRLAAQLAAAKALTTGNDLAIAQTHAAAVEEMSRSTEENLNRQISNYANFYKVRLTQFTTDEKGQDEKAKFEIESSQKIVELLNKLEVAQIQSDTARIQSATQTALALRQAEVQPLQDSIALAKADFDLQQAYYNRAPGLIGAANAARQKSLELIEAEGALEAKVIEQTITDQDRKTKLLIALDGELQAKRMAAVDQFPGFVESQLKAVVQSNTFSVSQIVTGWTGGIAQALVHWDSFTDTIKQVWQQTLTSLLQGALNFVVQWGANLLLAELQEIAQREATDAAKVASVNAANAEIVASEAATGATVSAIWGAVSTAIITSFEAIGSAVMTFMVETIIPALIAVGEAIMAFLSAIAEAMADTIFGIPIAIAIIAGIAGIGVAIAQLAGLKLFEKGGISFGPAIFGEKGPEAAIPLNDRGAAFMQNALGMGGGHMTLVMNEDGRERARKTIKYMPGIVKMRLGTT